MSITARLLSKLVLDKEPEKDLSVLEMGNQTYAVRRRVLEEVSKEIKHNYLEPHHRETIVTSLQALSEKPHARRQYEAGVPHAKELYKAFGYSRYTTIDIERSFESLVMDLNKDLKEEYNFTEEYDLVTDIGVMEHVFNPATFLLNAHRLTKEGGYMLHIVPCTGHMNHCFYNFHPRLFDDLAAANGYSVCHMYLTDTEDIYVNLLKKSTMVTHYFNHLHFLTKNKTGSLLIAVLMKKVQERPFVVPMQGMYASVAESGTFKRNDLSFRAKDSSAFFIGKGFYPKDAPEDTTTYARCMRKVQNRLFLLVRFFGRIVLRMQK